MISDPMRWPSRSRSCPFAWSLNRTCASAVTTSGYTTPSSTVVTTVIRNAIRRFFWIRMSREPQRRDDDVHDLDAHKGRDDAADAVDEEIAPQQRLGAHRTVRHAAQRERHQRDDDERIGDDRGQNRRLRRLEPHDVERDQDGE